ncbi:MAG: pseudouridine synthase, partial [Candidatus Limnocylindrales bacterium]
MAEARLQKVLAEAGVTSRRGAEAMIVAGRVTVDGVVAHLGHRVDPAVARILVDGRPVAGPSRHVYLALDKPIGVTSTVRDRHASRTVLDLVPPDLVARAGRLYPVGRLDRDSEGLLLLTNDGAWAHQVAHPSHLLEREYAVQTAVPLDGGHAVSLQDGIDLDEGLARLVALRPATDAETARVQASLAGPPSVGPW